jgi:hypothetical protein
MPSDQKTSIPRVPLQTPMFDGDMTALGKLTRTWIIFFERAFKAAATALGFGVDKATFGVGILYNIKVADDICPHYIVESPGDLQHVDFRIKVPPTGASLILDITRTSDNGTKHGSIFTTAPKLVFPAGGLLTYTAKNFLPENKHLSYKDVLKINCTQIGSTIPGKLATVVAKWNITES